MGAVDLVGALASVVGADHVLTDPDVRAGHEVDWTGRFRGATPAVVRPGSTDEVAGVLRACRDARVAVVPQGGNTGLVGGGVPLHGEVVLSLRRLGEVDALDEAAGQVTVGAGATLGDVQRRVRPAGFDVGVDFAARDSATIGGMVATNAGGVRLLRYGPMRAQVAGIEAVLAGGQVVSHLGGLLKDNTGYDLAGLLAGSEGTLAVVTRVRLRLVPRLDERVVALVGLGSVADAVTAVGRIRGHAPSLEAAEVMFDAGVRLVCAHARLPAPFAVEHPVYLLLEAASRVDPTDELAEAVGRAGDLIHDVAVATAPARRDELWRYREAHTEAINAAGVPHKLDVTLPAGALARFADEVHGAVAAVATGATVHLFGHLGDGNLHVNVLGGPEPGDAVDEAVLTLVASMGGSISAEHGIGTAKRRWLHLSRTPEEIAVFRSIKAAFDPDGVLNPHVLL
jgi:FAD/FMN-containing dehydrogenase